MHDHARLHDTERQKSLRMSVEPVCRSFSHKSRKSARMRHMGSSRFRMVQKSMHHARSCTGFYYCSSSNALRRKISSIVHDRASCIGQRIFSILSIQTTCVSGGEIFIRTLSHLRKFGCGHLITNNMIASHMQLSINGLELSPSLGYIAWYTSRIAHHTCEIARHIPESPSDLTH
jgi:hypothetical protein